MKKISYFFLASAIAVLMASCTEKEQEIRGTGHGYDDAVLTVAVDSLGNTGVKVAISSKGFEGAPYYGFFTDDVTTSAASVVAAKLKGISVTRHILSTGETVARAKGLRPGGKAYRYIATGLTASGSTYNEPAEVIFYTTGDLKDDSEGTITYPNPVAEPTTVLFSGFPGKYVYGMSDAETFTLEDLQKIMNDDLDGVNPAPTSATADKSVAFSINESGDYWIYAYELDENNYPTLSAKIFKLTVGSLDFSAYEALIGTWYLDGIEGSTLTFEQKVRGVSYTVKGIPALSATFPADEAIAEFDMESETLYLKEQDVAEGFTVGTYGACKKALTGFFVYGGKAYGYFPFNSDDFDDKQIIFSAKLNADGDLDVTGGACKYGAFANFKYSWYILSGENAGSGNWTTDGVNVPSKLTKEPAAPTEEYQAWIGTWFTEAGEEVKIEKDATNATYKISGIIEDVSITGTFYPDGTMHILSQLFGTNASGNSVYLYGIDQDDYVETGNPDDGTLAIATLAADGKSFTVVGDEYQATYSGVVYDEIIVALRMFGVTSSGSLASYESDPVDLPFTIYSEKPGPKAEYLAWLGDWNVTRVEEVSHAATADDVTAGLAAEEGEKVVDTEALIDTWTIAQDKVNASYIVTGIEGYDIEVAANFDLATGALTIGGQVVIEQKDSKDKNIFTVSLLGYIIYGGGYATTGTSGTPIFAATLADGKVTVTPAPFYTYGNHVGFRFYAKVGDNNSTYYSANGTPVPFNMESAASTHAARKHFVLEGGFPAYEKSLGVSPLRMRPNAGGSYLRTGTIR